MGHSREARQKLTADPTLAHLYHDYARGFKQKPGVEVIGAGDHQLNGWYTRKDSREGPSGAWSRGNSYSDWEQLNAGRYWYEKDDGCTIRAMNVSDTVYLGDLRIHEGWVICESNYGGALYCRVTAEKADGLPPAQGWSVIYSDIGAPAPTLRVVA